MDERSAEEAAKHILEMGWADNEEAKSLARAYLELKAENERLRAVCERQALPYELVVKEIAQHRVEAAEASLAASRAEVEELKRRLRELP